MMLVDGHGAPSTTANSPPTSSHSLLDMVALLLQLPLCLHQGTSCPYQLSPLPDHPCLGQLLGHSMVGVEQVFAPGMLLLDQRENLHQLAALLHPVLLLQVVPHTVEGVHAIE